MLGVVKETDTRKKVTTKIERERKEERSRSGPGWCGMWYENYGNAWTEKKGRKAPMMMMSMNRVLRLVETEAEKHMEETVIQN